MSSPTLTFPCPFCGRKMGVGTELLGKHVRCPHCKQVVLAPLGSGAAAVPTQAAASTLNVPPPRTNPSPVQAPAKTVPTPAKPLPAQVPAPTVSQPTSEPTPRTSQAPSSAPATPTAPDVLSPPSRKPTQPPATTAPTSSPWDDNAAPLFKFNQPKEAADSILSEPNESEDDLFGTSSGNKPQLPIIPELPPVPPSPAVPSVLPPTKPPAPRRHLPTPLPVKVPAQLAPVPAASDNPFAFDTELSPAAPLLQPVPQPVSHTAPLPVVPPTLPTPAAPAVPAVVVPQAPLENLSTATVASPGKRVLQEPSASTASGVPKSRFYALAAYALFMTLLAIYGLFLKSGEARDANHPLSTIPDSFGEFDPVSRKKVSQYKFPVDGELPANQVATLGGTIAIGQLEIEPAKIEARPLKVITQGKQEAAENTRPRTLVLHLNIKNTSPELPIFPMDPAFTRKPRNEDKPATCLVLGKQQVYYGSGIEWPTAMNVKRKYEEEQEKDKLPLKPGESRDYVVFTDSDPQILKAVYATQDPLLWRVQVRRGLIEYRGKDVPVTAIIGVEFKSSDVKKSD